MAEAREVVLQDGTVLYTCTLHGNDISNYHQNFGDSTSESGTQGPRLTSDPIHPSFRLGMVSGMHKHARILIDDESASLICLHISSFIHTFIYPYIVQPSDINGITPVGCQALFLVFRSRETVRFNSN